MLKLSVQLGGFCRESTGSLLSWKKSIPVRGKEAEEGSVESVHLMRGTAHQGVGDVLLCQLALGMVITWVGQAGAAPSPPVCCQP